MKGSSFRLWLAKCCSPTTCEDDARMLFCTHCLVHSGSSAIYYSGGELWIFNALLYKPPHVPTTPPSIPPPPSCIVLHFISTLAFLQKNKKNLKMKQNFCTTDLQTRCNIVYVCRWACWLLHSPFFFMLEVIVLCWMRESPALSSLHVYIINCTRYQTQLLSDPAGASQHSVLLWN